MSVGISVWSIVLGFLCGHCAVLLYLDISRFSVVQEVKVLGHLRSGQRH